MKINSRQVLIIDDTPEDCVTCRRYLGKDPYWQYEFIEAQKASTGLALAAGSQPDCILLDYALPDADGLTILTKLTDEANAPALPVVMLTGTGDTTLAVEAIKRGAQDYLVKGRFTPEDLQRAVNNAIEKAALIRARQQAEHERAELLKKETAARAQAEAANRLKDEFLATLSHELRTPLNHMLGWIVMLRTGKVEPQKEAEALATIERNVRAQSRLVEDLLDVSQMVAGKMQMRLQPVVLATAVSAAVTSARSAAAAKGVDLRMLESGERNEASDTAPQSATHKPNSAIIQGDPDRLQQLVWNLVANAIKFTPQGGQVQVQLACRNAHIELTVSDTGAGIAPEFLPFVFDHFSQADGSITRQHGGLGLGLAIVRHLVELHGGEVSVTSPGLQQGTTFKVKFPLTRSQPPMPDAPPLTASLQDSAEHDKTVQLVGVRVLAVDDEDDARSLLNAIFSESGAEVRAVGNMAEALSLLAEWRPDVLVSDISMPNGDGYDLIRAIRQSEAATRQWLPAVALTAYARAEDRIRALAAGFQMHVTKPVEPQELLLVVASLMASRE